MIDRFGNKIKPPAKKNTDPVLLEQEIRFMMKGFAVDPTDTKGRLLAIKGEALAEKLKSLSDPKSVVALLDRVVAAVAEFCPHSKNTDISWYMGWLCMMLYSASRIVSRHRTQEVDDIGNCCMFFERYEQLQPTNQGRTILVDVYTIRAKEFIIQGGAVNLRKALEILEKAKACDGRIHPAYPLHDRYGISGTMYFTLYEVCNSLGMKEAAFEAIQPAIRYAHKCVQVKADMRNIRNLTRYCHIYMSHPLFDRAADTVGMDTLISFIEDYTQKNFTIGVKDLLAKLKAIQNASAE